MYARVMAAPRDPSESVFAMRGNFGSGSSREARGCISMELFEIPQFAALATLPEAISVAEVAEWRDLAVIETKKPIPKA